jgi:hypothetical protein
MAGQDVGYHRTMTDRIQRIQRIHRGELFDVYRGHAGSREVIVKCLADVPSERRLAALGATWTHSNATNLFHMRALGWSPPGEAPPTEAHLVELLAAEQRIVERIEGAWNHPGAWLSETVEGTSCLAMPVCTGTSFAALPRPEQRRWFPRMIPALWEALSVCPHGDLKPDSLWLDDSRRFFRILDPGVWIEGPRRASRDAGLSFESQLMTTNAASYPLLDPEHGPKPPHLLATRCELEHALVLYDQGRSWTLAPAPPSERAPSAADVVALGAIYFAILTRASLAETLGLAVPMWCGFWRDGRGAPEDRTRDVRAALNRKLPRQLAGAGVREAEARLCVALVRLAELERLGELAAAAVAAA